MKKGNWMIKTKLWFLQKNVPERSSKVYIGLAPPSACLLTAADSLLSELPMIEDQDGFQDLSQNGDQEMWKLFKLSKAFHFNDHFFSLCINLERDIVEGLSINDVAA